MYFLKTILIFFVIQNPEADGLHPDVEVSELMKNFSVSALVKKAGNRSELKE